MRTGHWFAACSNEHETVYLPAGVTSHVSYLLSFWQGAGNCEGPTTAIADELADCAETHRVLAELGCDASAGTVVDSVEGLGKPLIQPRFTTPIS